jgi:hypothetical protein
MKSHAMNSQTVVNDLKEDKKVQDREHMSELNDQLTELGQLMKDRDLATDNLEELRNEAD